MQSLTTTRTRFCQLTTVGLIELRLDQDLALVQCMESPTEDGFRFSVCWRRYDAQHAIEFSVSWSDVHVIKRTNMGYFTGSYGTISDIEQVHSTSPITERVPKHCETSGGALFCLNHNLAVSQSSHLQLAFFTIGCTSTRHSVRCRRVCDPESFKTVGGHYEACFLSSRCFADCEQKFPWFLVKLFWLIEKHPPNLVDHST